MRVVALAKHSSKVLRFPIWSAQEGCGAYMPRSMDTIILLPLLLLIVLLLLLLQLPLLLRLSLG